MDLDLGRLREIWKRLSPGAALTLDGVHRRKDGTLFPVEVGLGAIAADGRELLLATARDVSEREETERALRESEGRYRALIENCPEAVAVLSEGKVAYVNRAAMRLAGAERPEEMVGRAYLDFVHPDSRKAVRAKVMHAQEGQAARLLRQKLLRLDGSAVDVEAVAIPTTFRGRPATQSVIRDTTERLRAEEALKESEERFRTAFENAPIGVALVSLPSSSSPASDRRYLKANRCLCEMFGFTEEEFFTKTSTELTHPEDREKSTLRMERMLAEGGSRYGIEKRYVRKDGRVLWASLNVSLVQDSEGNPSHFVSLIQDVTERKEAEAEIKQLSRRNRLILNSAGEGIYGLDREGRATFVNPAAAALTGFDPEELIGETLHDVIHHSRADGVPYPTEECPIYAALTDGEVHHVDDEVFWRKDGTSFPVAYTSTPIREGGEVIGAVVTFTDITERREAEARLKRLV